MRLVQHKYRPGVLLVFGVLSAGCGQAEKPGDVAPGGAGSAGYTPKQVRVTWNSAGRIDQRLGLAGTWWFVDDVSDATDAGVASTLPDPGLVGPDGQPGWSVSAQRVCLKGVAPRVVTGTDNVFAYDAQWGAALGLNLNNGDPYDALAAGVTGFMFDITTGSETAPAPPTLDVALSTANVKDGEPYLQTVILPAVDQVVSFASLEQARWVATPTPFRADQITGIVFQLYTHPQAPKPYDFCVSNLRALM